MRSEYDFIEKPLFFSEQERKTIGVYNSLMPSNSRLKTIYKLFDGSILAILADGYTIHSTNKENFMTCIETRIDEFIGIDTGDSDV